MTWIYTIGKIIALLGPSVCFFVVVLKFQVIQTSLKKHNFDLPYRRNFKYFTLFYRYQNLIKSLPQGDKKEKELKKLRSLEYSIILIPVLLVLGLLMMVIGRSI